MTWKSSATSLKEGWAHCCNRCVKEEVGEEKEPSLLLMLPVSSLRSLPLNNRPVRFGFPAHCRFMYLRQSRLLPLPAMYSSGQRFEQGHTGFKVGQDQHIGTVEQPKDSALLGVLGSR